MPMNYPEEAYEFDPLRRIGAEVVSLDEEGLRVRLDEPDLPAEMRVLVHRAGVNGEFDETLRLVEPGSRLNLVDVAVVDDALLPHYLVLEPDYLVDVSALAECVQEYGAGWQRYFWNRIRPKVVTDSILLGNSVNLMFDELVTADDCHAVTFESLMPKLFARYPIEFAAASSIDRSFFQILRRQFDTLQYLMETLWQCNVALDPQTLPRNSVAHHRPRVPSDVRVDQFLVCVTHSRCYDFSV